MSRGIRRGYSLPYIAPYDVDTGAYSTGMDLARGVSISASVESSDANNWYADNKIAETSGGRFTGGTLTVVNDDPDKDAINMLYGATTTSNVTYYEATDSPAVGFGAIVEFQLSGAVFYEYIIFPNVRFQPFEETATTETDSIEWQTLTLTATIGVDTNNYYKYVSDNQYSDESTAYRAMVAVLSPSSP